MKQRSHYRLLLERLNEQRKFIQIIEGPRQVGKSTVVKQVLQSISIPWMHFAADNVAASQNEWISSCWEQARLKMRLDSLQEMILVIDEVQKIHNWSEVVKKEWDNDSFADRNIKVVLLGSSRIRLEKGLSESLMGRFEVIKMPHWSFTECKECFNIDLEQYIYYGAYPGAMDFMNNHDRWQNYINSSIVDATINHDILFDTPISKPALLRQTFELAADYSGQQVSLTKMIGQLQDAGNTTTLAGYLQLLNQCGMVCGLQKYASDNARRRNSIPKYQVYNNALLSLYQGCSFKELRSNAKAWGRLVESAVGAHLLNATYETDMKLYYWREGANEVDFVLKKGQHVIALEVKSNSEKNTKGLNTFRMLFNPYRALVVGPGGLDLETFFSHHPKELFE